MWQIVQWVFWLSVHAVIVGGVPALAIVAYQALKDMRLTQAQNTIRDDEEQLVEEAQYWEIAVESEDESDEEATFGGDIESNGERNEGRGPFMGEN